MTDQIREQIIINGDEATYKHILQTGKTIQFKASEMRREKTGFHARIVISHESVLLAYDLFNVTRSEDRSRLAKRAHHGLGQDIGAIFPLEFMQHELDLFCQWVPEKWEQRHVIEEIGGSEYDSPIDYTLRPYLLDQGGTIMFAPPGQGKSYISLLQAQSIHQGVSRLWPVRQRKVLYVNLERPSPSMARRMSGVNRALGLPFDTPLPMLNARGQSLKAVAPTIKRAVDQGRAEVIFLDSISRAGFGTLVEDDNANAIVDTMNGIAPLWFAIAHSPRGDSGHIFGSQMFDAGEDIGVKLTSERDGDDLGIALEVVKANDTPIGRPQIIRLSFYPDDGGPLTGLESATLAETEDFPGLLAMKSHSRLETLTTFVEGLPSKRTTATQAASATGIPTPDVTALFLHSGRFVFVEQKGRERFYSLKPTPHDTNGYETP